MKPFIDLVGASGAVYRFRKSEGAPPPAGGNFVYLRDAGESFPVVCCGKARTLGWALAENPWAKDPEGQAGDQLYLRLNIVSGLRDSEHDDLVAGLPRPFAIYEFD